MIMYTVGAAIIIVLLIIAGIVFLSSSKLVCSAAVIIAAITLICMSLKRYDVLTNKEYNYIIFYRFICLFAIIEFSMGDVLQDIETEFHYDSFGNLLWVERTPIYAKAIPIGLIATFVVSLIFDIIIPNAIHGSSFSTFKPLGIFVLVIAIIWLGKNVFVTVNSVRK